MNDDPQNSNDVADPSDQADGSAEFAEFALTMKRAGVDWEPAAPLPARIPRGTVPPVPDDDVDADVDDDFDDDFDDDVDDDFDDAITLELPVLTDPEAPWLRRRRVLARSFTWVIALLLVGVAIAVVLAMRAERSSPAEPAPQGMGAAAAVVELPVIIVELDSPMSLPDDAEALVAAPSAHGGE